MSKILDYVPQPNAYTCQAACIAKMIGSNDVMSIRYDLESKGTPGDPYVMGNYLLNYVKEYKYTSAASINDMVIWLSEGYQLITHGYFTNSGHVISIQNYQDKYFLVDDPWGEFDANSWTYSNNNYGNNLPYSFKLVYATCVGGNNYAEAEHIYHSTVINEVDYDVRNAWVHRIKN